MRIRRPATTYLLAGVLAASLAACTSSTVNGRPEAAAPQPSGSARVATSSGPAVAAADAQHLATIAIRTSDLPGRLHVQLAPGGAAVTDEVTLDNCGYHFASELDRVARRQYMITDSADPTAHFGNEIVSYGTQNQAREALDEWHRSVTTCPSGYVGSAVAAEPAMHYSVKHDTSDAVALPVHLNETTTESAHPRHSRALWLTAVFQTRGRYLDAVYLETTHAPTAIDLRIATVLARATGRRLENTP